MLPTEDTKPVKALKLGGWPIGYLGDIPTEDTKPVKALKHLFWRINHLFDDFRPQKIQSLLRH